MKKLAAGCGGCAFLLLSPLLMLVLLFASVGGGTAAYAASCAATGGSGSGGSGTPGALDATQTANARTIIGVAKGMNLPDTATIIAIATAEVETTLHNVLTPDSHGSVGLFQQTPADGWGTYDEVTNTVYAATKFLARLTALPNWQSMPPGAAAQAVQASAYPDKYQQQIDGNTPWGPKAADVLAANTNAPAIPPDPRALSGNGGSGGSTPGAGGQSCLAGYVNPIHSDWYIPARTDMGTDWLPKLTDTPVNAIGAAKILYAQDSGTGWPRYGMNPNDNLGGCVVYQLLDGNLKDKHIYVCENINVSVKVGDTVTAGQQIAVSHSGGCCWTEWGWANPNSSGPSPLTPYNGEPDGFCTAGGIAFARFIHEIGGPWPTIDICPGHTSGDFGPGPDYP